MPTTAEEEAVHRLLDEVPDLAAEIKGLRRDVDTLGSEQVNHLRDTGQAVMTHREAQLELETNVDSLLEKSQKLRTDLNSLREEQTQLRTELLTNSDKTVP